jgi:hypothetical protein
MHNFCGKSCAWLSPWRSEASPAYLSLNLLCNLQRRVKFRFTLMPLSPQLFISNHFNFFHCNSCLFHLYQRGQVKAAAMVRAAALASPTMCPRPQLLSAFPRPSQAFRPSPDVREKFLSARNAMPGQSQRQKWMFNRETCLFLP